MPSLPTRGRSARYHSNGLWAVKKKNGGKFPVQKKEDKTAAPKTKKFGKKGQSRTIEAKGPRFYATEAEPKQRKSRKVARGSIRDSLQPGTVSIVLSGKFRGKRVVVLKRLASGLVLVSGPFKVNGVPLRRYSPAYLIATSTKLDISGLKWGDNAAKLKDSYFARPANFDKATNVENKKVTQERIALQKAVDTQLLAVVKQTPFAKEYLGSRFSLSKGQAPHLLKF